jgi:hypothetical protein
MMLYKQSKEDHSVERSQDVNVRQRLPTLSAIARTDLMLCVPREKAGSYPSEDQRVRESEMQTHTGAIQGSMGAERREISAK